MKVGIQLRFARWGLALAFLWSVGLPVFEAQAANRPASVVVKGSDPTAATHGTKVSHKTSTDQIALTLSLKLRNSDQLDQLLTELSDPTSAQYKNYLTPQQFTERFGPTQPDADKVTAYLASRGLSGSQLDPGRTLVKASGTVSQIEAAFGITVNLYRNQQGQDYYANEQSPVIASEISDLIIGVHGLDNEPHWQKHIRPQPGSGPNLGSGPNGGYTPGELRSAYNINPLISASLDGSGQKVALVELDGFVASHITTYVNYYGLGSPAPQTVLVGGYSGAVSDYSGESEVELDIEVVNAIAPKGQVLVYEAPNTNAGYVALFQKIATDNTAKVISSSWGLCEPDNSSSLINSTHTIFQQFAAQGQSFFAASGDAGAYDCGTASLSVDTPANDPYVSGVGGTRLLLSGGAYGSEVVWNNSSGASGGGLSTYFSKPGYQTGPNTTNASSNGKRQVPDVAADADPNTGYSIYTVNSAGAANWYSFGGTSASAPLWAGLIALNNQYAANLGQSSLGEANPKLYRLFNTAQPYTAYHDITSGNNSYYSAAAGYDFATGIGTLDAYNLVRDLNASITPGSAALIYYPLPKPIRFIDTRTAPGTQAKYAAGGALNANETRNFAIAGQSYQNIVIPAQAKAVEGNAQVALPSSAGYLTVYPGPADGTGLSRPTAATMLYNVGQYLANEVTLTLGSDGTVNLYSFASTDVLLDITGYYAPAGTPDPNNGNSTTNGLVYYPLSKPLRLLDTRSSSTVGYILGGGPLAANSTHTYGLNNLTYQSVNIPSSARALVGNVQVASPSVTGFLTLYPGPADPGGTNRPVAASMLYNAGQYLANGVNLTLGSDGTINLYTFGSTEVLLDITGYYAAASSGTGGLSYYTLSNPTRLVDTRASTAALYSGGGPFAAGETRAYSVTGVSYAGVSLPSSAKALVGNVQVAAPAGSGYLTIYPGPADTGGVNRPTVSTMLYNPGQYLANAFLVAPGSDSKLNIYAFSRSDILLDVSGYFQ